MARLVVVVPKGTLDVYQELQAALAGEDASIIVDRRRGERRRRAAAPGAERRRADRRGQWAPATAARS